MQETRHSCTPLKANKVIIMGKQRLGENQISKRARARANKRNMSPAVKQRQRVARQLGEAMYKAGGRAGRVPIPVDRIPNLDNYRQITRGMRRRLRRVDLRRLRNRGNP